MKNEKINYNQKIDNDCVEIVPSLKRSMFRPSKTATHLSLPHMGN